MTFLPIVERELRVNARRRATYYSRLGGVVIAVCMTLWLLLMSRSLPPAMMSKMLFQTLSWMCMLFCLGAGTQFTSDCLSEEKRDGTLGLLFLTDLRGWDIVLGKLVARSLAAFYGMMALTPVLTIPLLMGGVVGSEVARVVLALLSALFFSLCIGVLSSALSTKASGAMTLTLVLTMGVAIGMPLSGAAYTYSLNLSEPPKFFLVCSPGFALFAASETVFLAESTGFWTSIASALGLGVSALVLASVVLPNAWQDRAASPTRAGLAARARVFFQGQAALRAQVRAVRLDINPIFWLATRDRLKVWLPWIFLGAVAGIWGWIAVKFGEEWFNEATYFLTTFALFSIFKFWIASEAVGRFWEGRRNGALELVLSTPLSVRDILSGQALSFQKQFLAPLCVTGLVSLGFMVAPFWSKLLSAPGSEIWTLMFLAGLVVFVLDVVACFWTGLWMGLTTQRLNRASGSVVWRVVMLPWGLYLGTLAVVSLLAAFDVKLHLLDSNAEYWLLGLWLLYGAGNAVYWIVVSHRRLNTQFRDIAASERQGATTVSRPWWRLGF